jgi:hypothetical protein
MQSADWIELFRRIPQKNQSKMMLVTSIGIEISMQNVMRLDPEYLVLRGRLAGTTEMGRVFFIPYDQINYINFNFEMTDLQYEGVVGPVEFPLAREERLPDKPEAQPRPPSRLEAPPPLAADAEAGAVEAEAPAERPAVKETLLERLRARAASSKQPPKP